MDWYTMVQNEYGYTPISTFWTDFTIADKFGTDAIQDTFNRAFTEWKTDYKMLTELVMVLNHKIWHYYGNQYHNEIYAELYNKLWEQADAYAVDNLKGDEANYYFNVLD